MQVKQGETVLTDSGDVYDTTLTGGRLGMLVFGQQDVIWSRLEARCADRSVATFALSQKKKHKIVRKGLESPVTFDGR